ncbi:MAG: 30S ribosomal protein S4 [Bacteroidota bacterium]
MARYTGPRGKIERKFKEPILGHGKALERRKTPPGQHGKSRRRKVSDYGVQLAEKQKAKYTYGLLEKQFRNTFKKAASRKGVTGEVFLQLLESRLDNIVYRMGFAPTRRAARQLVTHKHVMMNGVVTNIPSALLKPGDVVEIREKSKNLELISTSLARAGRFGWLTVEADQKRGTFDSFPSREDIPEKINEQLIVELYSK